MMDTLSPLLFFLVAAVMIIVLWSMISRRFWGRDTQIHEAKRTNQLLETLIKNQHAMREDQRTMFNHLVKRKKQD